MFGSVRKTLSGGTLVGVALLGLLVVASAPAGSGPATQAARSFVAAGEYSGKPLRAVEGVDARARRVGNTIPALADALRIAEVAGGNRSYRLQHAVAGESVSATLASPWHADGFTGKGVKIAIIDGGFAGLSQRQAEGDLPANAVTQDNCGGRFATADDHGTAVAEIVHEMAPDAQLYLVCIESDTDFAAAVAYAKSQGVHIVNFSAGWEGPFRNDGSDRFSAIVADARASGILWVNSAGNQADTHWSGAYTPGDDRVHDWSSNGDEGNTFMWPNDSVICGFLRWDEWPNAASDFDLALVHSGTNTLLAIAEDEQTGSQPPFEATCVEQSSGSDLQVYWAIVGYRVTSSPQLDLVSWSPPLQYSVAAGSIAAPATSSAAFAVGAVCWQSRQLEPYSSQGPTIDGRVKPDIVAHDSVSSATYGAFDGSCPSGFAGTSASSPEVAGAAALVKQAFPSYTADQLKQYLMRYARDLGSPGLDSTYGAGELQLPEPPDLVAPAAKALPSTGRLGKTVKLVSSVSDDSGAVSVVEQVLLGSKTVATIKRSGFVSAPSPKTVATAWKAPAKAGGRYRHCVRVTDRAGNTSPISCARLTLR